MSAMSGMGSMNSGWLLVDFGRGFGERSGTHQVIGFLGVAF
jgi:hypothetical protein